MPLKALLHRRLSGLVQLVGCLPAPRGERFVILTHGRTGSTLLCDLLDSHPRIRCQGELLIHPKRFPLAFLRGCALFPLLRRRHWGFKVKLEHLRKSGLHPEAVFRRWHEEGVRFIYLYREDHLRTALSAEIAHLRQAYHLQETKQLPQVSLNPGSVIRKLQRVLEGVREEEKIMQPYPHFRISYEEHLEDPAAVQELVPRVCAFLGVADEPLRSNFRKVTSSNLRDDVSNLDEVLDAVRKSEVGEAVKASLEKVLR